LLLGLRFRLAVVDAVAAVRHCVFALEAAGLDLLLAQQLLVLLLMAYEVVLLQTALVQVALFAIAENALEVGPTLLRLVDLQVLL